MKPLIPALLLLVVGSAQAAPIAMEDQSQLKVPGKQAALQFTPPAEDELPANAFGKMVREGHALFVDTRRLMPEAVATA
jgi:thiosulfate dehydrogenase